MGRLCEPVNNGIILGTTSIYNSRFMDETQNQNQTNTAPEPTSQAPASQSDSSGSNNNSNFSTILIVGAVILGVAALAMFLMKDKDVTQTEGGLDPEQVVATVNGSEIVGADLTTSISQIAATAQIQGIDVTDPAVQGDIQAQAVEMLVNTALLEQEAESRGIEVTNADVEARIEALIQEIGSEDALNQRMANLGIDSDTLREDVRSELMIQELLDQVFAGENITVTDEEINSLYETSTAGDAAAPELAEVRSQVEAQIRASKEQVIVDEFIASLRSGANIELAQ